MLGHSIKLMLIIFTFSSCTHVDDLTNQDRVLFDKPNAEPESIGFARRTGLSRAPDHMKIIQIQTPQELNAELEADTPLAIDPLTIGERAYDELMSPYQSGHEAGYEWAENKGITDAFDCEGNSQSFIDGCEEYVEEMENIR